MGRACELVGWSRSGHRLEQNWLHSKFRFTPGSLLSSLELLHFCGHREERDDSRFPELWGRMLDRREGMERMLRLGPEGCSGVHPHKPHSSGLLVSLLSPHIRVEPLF